MSVIVAGKSIMSDIYLLYCRPYEDESSGSSSSESDDEDEGRGGYASEPTGGFSNVSETF